MTTFDSSQRAVYTVDPEDDRHFDVSANLTAVLAPPDFATAEVVQPTAGERYKVILRFTAPGTSELTIRDEDSGLEFKDPILTSTGGIATLGVGAAVVEEDPDSIPPVPEP